MFEKQNFNTCNVDIKDYTHFKKYTSVYYINYYGSGVF